jgi:acyl carrier protein
MSLNVEEIVKEIVAEQLGVPKDSLTDESLFVEDLGADSLDLVELVMEMEEEFDLTISDEEAENLKTVGSVVSYVTGKRAKR